MTHVGSYGDLSLHHHHPRSAISRKFADAAPDINGKVTKLKELSPLHETPQRPAASPTRESWEWCHHAAQTAIPTLSGVFTAKAIVVYLLMYRRSYFISRDGDDSGHICFYLISQPQITAIYHGPVDDTSFKWRRPRRNVWSICDLN